MAFILSIDQGTTSTRAIIYDEAFRVISVGQKTFPQYYPEPGWVEHDLGEIWDSVENAVLMSLAKAQEHPAFSADKISAIGITNQRETFGLWRAENLQPLRKAIVWQCRRSANICEKLQRSAAGRKMASITGLVLDPYFSGTKLKWVLDNDSGIKKLARSGGARFGTMDTFLIAKLSGAAAHVTDVTNASRTMLMDLKRQVWSEHCLKTLNVPSGILPQILSSNAKFAVTRGLSFLPDGIPIHGVLGDQQAALFGQECFSSGDAKVTYGTGAFLLMNTGSQAKKSKNGLSTVAWRINGKTTYALEGSVFIAGAAVQWLRDGLKLVEKSSEIESLAAQVKDTDGAFFIPALSGLGSPYWAPLARGVLGGLTRGTTKAHIARACLEGIAFSVGELLVSLRGDAKIGIKRLRVDGGASLNSILMQFQSDITGVRIQRPQDIESTARGAAYMAALGCGLVKNEKEFISKNLVQVEFKPQVASKRSQELMAIWRRRVKALLMGCY
ncbi:MAG: glycerol kinase GlpK [Bdellovibrionales bacterium]|nr:glycerol kinase GlpK [Bdellovibrionales bacterium]